MKKKILSLGIISVCLFFGVIVAKGAFATTCVTDEDGTTCTESGSINASVIIPSACSFTVTEGSGTYREMMTNNSSVEITGSTFKTICNDPNGFAVYAVGFSNREIGNTDLVALGYEEDNIKTDGEDSYWKMKISGVATGPMPTIENGFDSYHNIPAEYTKIASRAFTTPAVSGGSSISVSYNITTSATQANHEYEGAVKYVLVHPGSLTPVSLEESFANNGKQKYNGYYKMQDMNSDICSETTLYGSMSETQLIDIRDNKIYYVTKLEDGNCWMTQNLDHDIVTTPNFYTSFNTDIPEGTSPLTMNTATYSIDDTTWLYYGIESRRYPESYDPGNICWDGDIDNRNDISTWDHIVDCDMPTANNHYSLGNYYNWTAAVVMNNSINYSLETEDVDQSICPAGWRLPIYSGNKSYDQLVNSLNLTAGIDGNIHTDPIYFAYSGSWVGEPHNIGHMGNYWSNTPSSINYAYRLEFISGDDGNYVITQSEGNRVNGNSVRCVAR